MLSGKPDSGKPDSAFKFDRFESMQRAETALIGEVADFTNVLGLNQPVKNAEEVPGLPSRSDTPERKVLFSRNKDRTLSKEMPLSRQILKLAPFAASTM